MMPPRIRANTVRDCDEARLLSASLFTYRILESFVDSALS